MKSLSPRVGAQNESHSAFVKESWWHSAADSKGQVSSRPLLGLTELVQVQQRPESGRSDGSRAIDRSSPVFDLFFDRVIHAGSVDRLTAILEDGREAEDGPAAGSVPQ